MKKNLIFLIILCAFIMGQSLNVNAATKEFYEGEYIDNIYINKQMSKNPGTIFYQKARFFREVGTNLFAYCIEPDATFKDGSKYFQVVKPDYISYKQMDEIVATAYYGYMYKNHEDPKWYAITQLMIWQIVDPQGDYYFTDSLNGNRINQFEGEINEIKELVNDIKKVPDIPKSITVVEGTNIILEDKNNALKNYTTSMGKIYDNKLELGKLSKGKYSYKLTKSPNYFSRAKIFYTGENSQDMFITGNITSSLTTNTINVVNTKVKIHKIDAESKNSLPRGTAKLEGTIYKLYDNNHNEINQLVIDSNGYAEINNLDFGTYYIKEFKAGNGYNIDNKEYKIILNSDNLEIELNLENSIIKKNIVINKTYGTNDNFLPEKDIIFNIYDKNNNLVTSVKTDDNGHAEVTLNFGKYTIKQLNTNEGYEKIAPINLSVSDNEEIIYNLQDYKISVPDTRTNIFLIIIKKLLSILCLKI